jgi:hypothetical protein
MWHRGRFGAIPQIWHNARKQDNARNALANPKIHAQKKRNVVSGFAFNYI